MIRDPAEEKLITRLHRVLGKNLNQSDIDFLHVLVLPDVIDFTLEYVEKLSNPNACDTPEIRITP